ncbi:hypothetical protein [Parabacteroides sp.]
MKQRLHPIPIPRRYVPRIIFLLLSLLLLTPWTGRAQGTPPHAGTEADPFVVDGDNLEGGAAENGYTFAAATPTHSLTITPNQPATESARKYYKLKNLTADKEVYIKCSSDYTTLLVEEDIELASLHIKKGELRAPAGKSVFIRVEDRGSTGNFTYSAGATIAGNIKLAILNSGEPVLSDDNEALSFLGWAFNGNTTEEARYQLREKDGSDAVYDLAIPKGVAGFAVYIPADKVDKKYTLWKSEASDWVEMQAYDMHMFTHIFKPEAGKHIAYAPQPKPYGPLTTWKAGTLQYDPDQEGWYVYDSYGRGTLFNGTLSNPSTPPNDVYQIRVPETGEATLTLADGFSVERIGGSVFYIYPPTSDASGKRTLTLEVGPAADGGNGTATLKAGMFALNLKEFDARVGSAVCEVAGESSLFLYGGVYGESLAEGELSQVLYGLMEWRFKEAPAAGSTILVKDKDGKTLASFEGDGSTTDFACNVPYGDCTVWVQTKEGRLVPYKTEADAGGKSRSRFNYANADRPYTRISNLVPPEDLDLTTLDAAPITLTCTAAGEWTWAYTNGDPATQPAQPFSGCVMRPTFGTFAHPLTVVIDATAADNTGGTLTFDNVKVELTEGTALTIRKDGEHKAALKLATGSNGVNLCGTTALAVTDVDCDARPGESPARIMLLATERAVTLSDGATLAGVSSFSFPEIPEGSLKLKEEREGSFMTGFMPSSKYKSFGISHATALTMINSLNPCTQYQARPEGEGTAYLHEFPATDTYKSYVEPKPYALLPQRSSMSITLSDTENKDIELVDCTDGAYTRLTLLGDRKLTLRNSYGVYLQVGEKDGTSAPSTALVTLEGEPDFTSICLRKGSGLTLAKDGGVEDVIWNVDVSMEEGASLSTKLPIVANKFLASIGTVGDKWRAVGLSCKMVDQWKTLTYTPDPNGDWLGPDGQLVSDNIIYPKGLIVRTGFSGKTNQRWEEAENVSNDDGAKAFRLYPDAGYIMAAEKAGESMEILLYNSNGLTIHADATLVTDPFADPLADGEFRFLPNPSLCPIRLRDIYTLNADGTRFELQEEEVEVQPFEAFLTANALTRQSLRSVGVGEPQTGDSLVTGIAAPPSLTAAALRVWGASGEMHLSTSRPADVRIFSLSGLPLRSFHLDGDRVEPLPAGIYLVVCEGLTYKIVL